MTPPSRSMLRRLAVVAGEEQPTFRLVPCDRFKNWEWYDGACENCGYFVDEHPYDDE